MTERAEYTPGPWRENGCVIEGPRMGLQVAQIQYRAAGGNIGFASQTKTEALANARLIAAAPDLLAALRGLVEVNEAHNESIAKIIGKPLDWKDDYLEAARAAISRATGEA